MRVLPGRLTDEEVQKQGALDNKPSFTNCVYDISQNNVI